MCLPSLFLYFCLFVSLIILFLFFFLFLSRALQIEERTETTVDFCPAEHKAATPESRSFHSLRGIELSASRHAESRLKIGVVLFGRKYERFIVVHQRISSFSRRRAPRSIDRTISTRQYYYTQKSSPPEYRSEGYFSSTQSLLMLTVSYWDRGKKGKIRNVS